MTTTTHSYADFGRRRDQIEAVLKHLAEAFRRLDATERADALQNASRRLHNETFKVMVVGEFKRGKSTLINALLGQNVLPAKVAPCTAVITCIRYGEVKRAVLMFKDGRPHLQVSLQGSADDLKKFITIQDDGEDDGDLGGGAVNRSPYKMAYVFYPLPLCRNNVEIVDSPGLNEHKTRTEVTKAFFAETDAMVMVLSCEQALSESERRFIDVDLQGRDLRDVFFLWNRFDAIQDSPDDVSDIRKLSRDKLEQKIGRQGRVFFVSARDALQGRKNNQPALVGRSNVQQFEAALEQFLSTERGRVKLRTPLRQVESAIREGTLELIPRRESLLRQPVEELRRKLEQQRPRLEEAERQEERLVRAVERRREGLTRDLEGSYRTLAERIEAGVHEQAQLIQPTMWQTITDRSGTKAEINNRLAEWMNQQMKRWEQETLEPLVSTHLKELEVDLDDRAHEFLANLDTVKAAFVPKVDAKPGGASEPEVSGLSRLVGGGVGLFVGGIGSAMEGASMGAGQMMRGLGANISVAVALIVAGFELPVILPALLAVGVYRTLTGARRQADVLRDAAVAEIIAGLRSQRSETEQEMQAQVKLIFDRIHRGVSERMSLLVDEVRGQVQSVIQEREQHEGTAERELALLASVREELAAQAKLLETLKTEIEMA